MTASARVVNDADAPVADRDITLERRRPPRGLAPRVGRPGHVGDRDLRAVRGRRRARAGHGEPRTRRPAGRRRLPRRGDGGRPRARADRRERQPGAGRQPLPDARARCRRRARLRHATSPVRTA